MITHLMYHCFAVNNWKEIVDDILYWDSCFTGKKIATIPEFGEYKEAESLFKNKGFDTIIVPHDGFHEHAGLKPAIDILKYLPGATFRSHTKGVIGKIDKWKNERWRRTPLWHCLNNLDVIQKMLATHRTVGTFFLNPNDRNYHYKDFCKWPGWFYAGSQYWIRNAAMRDPQRPLILPQHTHTSEYIPCIVSKAEEAGRIGPNWGPNGSYDSWGEIAKFEEK